MPPLFMPDSYPHILAIETATRVQALALLDGTELAEHRVQRVRYNHGSSLLKNIDQLLAAREIELEDIDLFAVGLGPGSFTGLRVGLATAKALSRTTERPIVGVSSLAALAYTPARTRPGATVVATIDARRREVYAGAYRWNQGQLEMVIEDCAIAPHDWIERVDEEVTGPIIQVGDGQTRYPVLAEWDSPDLTALGVDLAPPSAVGVAHLGRQLALIDGPADRVALEPNYIRPSDARLPDKPPGPMPKEPESTE